MKLLLALIALQPACSGCNDNNSRHIIDSPKLGEVPLDAFDPVDASDPNSTILITQSPGGPQNGDPLTWGGVLQFQVGGDGGALTAGLGLDKAMLEDPVSVAFRSASSEVFVSDRHGNNSADGVAGSITRYHYTQATHVLDNRTEITGATLAGVHQVALSPTTGELFAANVNTAIARFTFDANNAAIPNGTIANGPIRGVFVTPDGKRLFATTAANVIRIFDLATGTELAPITLATTGNLHFFAYRKGEVYVAALGDNLVYRYTLDANDDLIYRDSFAAQSPIGIAFSADGNEMFVTGHITSDVLQRYTFANDGWTPAGTMDLGSSLGGIVILPG